MKNLFERESNKGLIAGLIIGGVVAAGLAYLFFTDDGKKSISGLKRKIKDKAKKIASGVVSDKTGISKKTVRKAADVVMK